MYHATAKQIVDLIDRLMTDPRSGTLTERLRSYIEIIGAIIDENEKFASNRIKRYDRVARHGHTF